MRNKLIFIMIFIICSSAFVVANDEKEKKEKGKLKANYVRYKKDDNIYVATGNVNLDYKESVVTSEKLRMERNQDKAYFSNNVHLVREEDDIKSKELEMDLKEDILIATDDVKLNSTLDQSPFYLTSNYLKIWTETNDMLAREDIFVDYDKQEIKGENLKYTKKNEKIVVTENVEVREDEDWMKCEKAIFLLDDDIIDAYGQVEMEFMID